MSSSGEPGVLPWVQKDVPTLIKDQRLVAERRRQIVQAAVKLFTAKGFHPTTTREIAAAAGLGIGTLYEYVRSKEDILYLVCDQIHQSVEVRLKEAMTEARTGQEGLVQAVAAYFGVCDALSDDILLIYQEAKSLTPEARRFVLANEVRVTRLFQDIIERGVADGSLSANGAGLELMAHNIAVLGHMWTFRRWHLGRRYSLEQYTELQTSLILKELDPTTPAWGGKEGS